MPTQPKTRTTRVTRKRAQAPRTARVRRVALQPVVVPRPEPVPLTTPWLGPAPRKLLADLVGRWRRALAARLGRLIGA
jgi:hypothetical protein